MRRAVPLALVAGCAGGGGGNGVAILHADRPRDAPARDRRRIVGSFCADAMLAEAPVASDDKDPVVARADSHGQPRLLADHGAPTSMPPNAIDWYGFWKWGDALCDAGLLGTNRALGGAMAQRFMGRWSDGVAVIEPIVD